ncbi:MAG: hypothetical protein B7Z08_05965 [Sphingomonadales bacterium 32-68-7]|nr:MAG: hypothetical protein B7Z33_11215 [Sphingomonadales bacterium 12-68-11]OYX09285.1 MAG: hypothetical protein B7Z08_05965 [Sphingomonadales bacterium 32-68-7]
MEVAVNVAVEESADFETVIAQAQRSGLKISSRYDALRIASGTIDKDLLRDLALTKGIKSVEEEREVRAI